MLHLRVKSFWRQLLKIMDWGSNENRIVVIGLKQCGMERGDIFRMLQPLGVTRIFLYRTVKLFEDTGGIIDRPKSGRPRVVRAPAAIRNVKERIERNPLRKQKILAREMKISPISIQSIIKHDLGLRAYKRHTGHQLTVALKQQRKLKSEALRRQYAKDAAHRRILFTNEKIFTVEKSFNKQNDRVYARSSREASQLIPRVERGHQPASVGSRL